MKAIMRLSAVIAVTGVSRADIYRKMNASEFPKSIPLGVKSVGWLQSEVEEWIDSRVSARDLGASLGASVQR